RPPPSALPHPAGNRQTLRTRQTVNFVSVGQARNAPPKPQPAGRSVSEPRSVVLSLATSMPVSVTGPFFADQSENITIASGALSATSTVASEVPTNGPCTLPPGRDITVVAGLPSFLWPRASASAYRWTV